MTTPQGLKESMNYGEVKEMGAQELVFMGKGDPDTDVMPAAWNAEGITDPIAAGGKDTPEFAAAGSPPRPDYVVMGAGAGGGPR